MTVNYQNTNYNEVIRRVPGLQISYCGGYDILQCGGNLDDFSFRMKYDGEIAELRINSDITHQPCYMSKIEVASDFNFTEVFIALIKKISIAPIQWTFEGVMDENAYLYYGSPGKKCSLSAYGYTSQQAWDNLHDSGTTDPQYWKEFISAHHLSPKAVTIDQRVFPLDFLPITVLD